MDKMWGTPPDEDERAVRCSDCGAEKTVTKPGLKTGGRMFTRCNECGQQKVHEAVEDDR